ncbi:DUF4190 domain-containing protein [bacterium]|nr:DUF4190 domain-containing protein [bacterium]
MNPCSNCGTQNSDAATFCINCGSSLEKKTSSEVATSIPPPQANVTPQSASGRAIAALILGLLSIVFSCGPVTGIAGIVLANQELNAIRNGSAPEAGKTLAQIGMWTGWIGTIACGLFWIAYIAIIVLAIGFGGFR